MTNEEILEELYHIAYSSGVYKQFSENVNSLLKTNGFSIHDAASKVYFEFIERGLIANN